MDNLSNLDQLTLQKILVEITEKIEKEKEGSLEVVMKEIVEKLKSYSN
ncbi:MULTISPECIES: hypothetical protein [Bacillaceae]|nr:MULTISPECIES: hypothetical protein [Bacillaceae]